MHPKPFTASGIAAVCKEAARTIPEMNPAFTTPSERRTAARAILRHKLHANNDAVASGAHGGLHRFYGELHGRDSDAQSVEPGKVKLVLRETFEDFLDAVSPRSLRILVNF